MKPGGGELGHGAEDEVAEMHTWMREGEAQGGDDPVGDGYEVDVDGTVNVAAVGTAVWRGVDCVLDFQEPVEDGDGDFLAGVDRRDAF